mmetsp:Transcript_30501/g.78903  ORF Transcript_30501/g.78903 Transcript_30501/m.78903 type:complete len:265 (+) Transcript_30501:2101-2895(+)
MLPHPLGHIGERRLAACGKPVARSLHQHWSRHALPCLHRHSAADHSSLGQPRQLLRGGARELLYLHGLLAGDHHLAIAVDQLPGVPTDSNDGHGVSTNCKPVRLRGGESHLGVSENERRYEHTGPHPNIGEAHFLRRQRNSYGIERESVVIPGGDRMEPDIKQLRTPGIPRPAGEKNDLVPVSQPMLWCNYRQWPRHGHVIHVHHPHRRRHLIPGNIPRGLQPGHALGHRPRGAAGHADLNDERGGAGDVLHRVLTVQRLGSLR